MKLTHLGSGDGKHVEIPRSLLAEQEVISRGTLSSLRKLASQRESDSHLHLKQ